MVDTIVSLGGFTFSGWGVPEHINGGGKQRLVVHSLIGGGRVIDAMGWNPEQLKFSGRLRGGEAAVLVTLLETIARIGAPVVFSYWTHRYQVLVARISWKFERFYEITYDLTLEVLSDLTQDSWQSSDPTLDASFSNDLVAVASVAAVLPTLQGGISTVSTIKSTVGPLGKATSIAVAPLVRAVTTVAATAVALVSSLDSGQPVGPVGGVIAGGNPAVVAANLSGSAGNFQQLAAAVLTSAVLTRMSINLRAKSQ